MAVRSPAMPSIIAETRREPAAPAHPSSSRRQPASTRCTLLGPDDRLRGHRQLGRVEQERPRLRPAEPAVERDQLLEGAALVERGVVEAADQQMSATCAKPSVRRRCCGACGEKRRERILALDPALLAGTGCRAAEHDRAVLAPSATSTQPMCGCSRSAGMQRRDAAPSISSTVSRRSLLHQVDEAEIAGAEHDDVAAGDVVLLRLRLPPGRLAQRRGRPSRSCSSPPATPLTPPSREVALDELVEAVAVALLERRPLRLAVVGEDDELVRPRGVAAGGARCGANCWSSFRSASSVSSRSSPEWCATSS